LGKLVIAMALMALFHAMQGADHFINHLVLHGTKPFCRRFPSTQQWGIAGFRLKVTCRDLASLWYAEHFVQSALLDVEGALIAEIDVLRLHFILGSSFGLNESFAGSLRCELIS